MGILSGLWAGAKMVLGLGSSTGKGVDNVMTVAKGVGNFIDEQKFTKQEQSEYNVKLIGHMDSFMANSVSENTERSKARREIALLVMRWALAMLTLSGVLHLCGWTEDAKFIRDLVIDDPIGYFVLGIGAFFFGAHIVRAMKKDE